jgi:hypothetical protein
MSPNTTANSAFISATKMYAFQVGDAKTNTINVYERGGNKFVRSLTIIKVSGGVLGGIIKRKGNKLSFYQVSYI